MLYFFFLSLFVFILQYKYKKGVYRPTLQQSRTSGTGQNQLNGIDHVQNSIPTKQGYDYNNQNGRIRSAAEFGFCVLCLYIYIDGYFVFFLQTNRLMVGMQTQHIIRDILDKITDIKVVTTV